MIPAALAPLVARHWGAIATGALAIAVTTAAAVWIADLHTDRAEARAQVETLTVQRDATAELLRRSEARETALRAMLDEQARVMAAQAAADTRARTERTARTRQARAAADTATTTATQGGSRETDTDRRERRARLVRDLNAVSAPPS